MSAELRKMVTNSYLTHRESDNRNREDGHSLQTHGGAVLELLSSHVVEGKSLVHRTTVWER